MGGASSPTSQLPSQPSQFLVCCQQPVLGAISTCIYCIGQVAQVHVGKQVADSKRTSAG
jgi:hypothetical protein